MKKIFMSVAVVAMMAAAMSCECSNCKKAEAPAEEAVECCEAKGECCEAKPECCKEGAECCQEGAECCQAKPECCQEAAPAPAAE